MAVWRNHAQGYLLETGCMIPWGCKSHFHKKRRSLKEGSLTPSYLQNFGLTKRLPNSVLQFRNPDPKFRAIPYSPNHAPHPEKPIEGPLLTELIKSIY